jgi:hypothetical protein
MWRSVFNQKCQNSFRLNKGLDASVGRPIRLILRAGRDAPIAGEVREERFDLRLAQLARVLSGIADLVESDELVDPAQVGFFSVEGVVEESEFGANLIHELHGGSPTGRRVMPRRAGVKMFCRAERGFARIIWTETSGKISRF